MGDNRRRRRRRGRLVRAHDHTFKKQDLPSGQESVESHTDFILTNWELAAAGSWRGYQQDGRGAIVIDVAGVEESPAWAPRFVAGIDLAMTTGYYVADRQIQEIGIGWPIPEATRMVQQYDPEREVVFIFLREDAGVSSYRIKVSGALTPPEAYAQYKEEL